MGNSELISLLSIIGGFGVTILVFRIQRELEMKKENRAMWIPGADRLLILAIIIVFGWIIVMLFNWKTDLTLGNWAVGLVVVTLMLGYIFAILAHYGLLSKLIDFSTFTDALTDNLNTTRIINNDEKQDNPPPNPPTPASPIEYGAPGPFTTSEAQITLVTMAIVIGISLGTFLWTFVF
jgi:hypothetical protein